MKKQNIEIFNELVEWSLKKDSFALEDFLRAHSLTIADLRNIVGNKRQSLIAVGQAVVNTYKNAWGAWKEKRISRDLLAKFLKEQHRFSNPEFIIEKFERGNQEFVLPEIDSFIDECVNVCSIDLCKTAQMPLH